MIKHVVCFKLANNGTAEKQEAAEVLLSMKGKVPVAKDIEVGVDFLGDRRSFDLVLQVTLENVADLEAYQKDKYHCEVVKSYMHVHTVNSISVDYQVD